MISLLGLVPLQAQQCEDNVEPGEGGWVGVTLPWPADDAMAGRAGAERIVAMVATPPAVSAEFVRHDVEKHRYTPPSIAYNYIK